MHPDGVALRDTVEQRHGAASLPIIERAGLAPHLHRHRVATAEVPLDRVACDLELTRDALRAPNLGVTIEYDIEVDDEKSA